MVIIRVMGGLGNQMFLYAFARKLDVLGYQVRLDVKRPYKNFEVEKTYIQRRYGLGQLRICLKEIDLTEYGKWKYIRNSTVSDRLALACHRKGMGSSWFADENDMGREEWKELEAGRYKAKDIYFFGVFQKEWFFRDIRNILLKELRPKKEIILSVGLNDILQKENTVCIHVRRGDYLEHKEFYGVCSMNYYRRAVEEIRRRVKNPYFLIFTDDPELMLDLQLKEGENVLYVGREGRFQDYEELALMSRCRNHIIANSTFSWWGAWLAGCRNGITIAPKIWFRGNPAYRIVPAEWMKI